MELEEKLRQQAIDLTNKLESMADKNSESYKTIVQIQEKTMEMLSQESARLNSNQKAELEAKRLEFEKDKLELETLQKKLEAQLEEEKLKQQKRSHGWDIAKKIIGGIIAVLVNLITMFFMIRFNNSGETLTSMESKFIFPEKFR